MAEPFKLLRASVELDNPIWSSLRTRHRGIARVHGEVARYPAEYAPFLGIAHEDVDAGEAFDALVAPGEDMYLLGVVPTRMPRGWRLEPLGEVLQMECPGPIAEVDGPPIVPLDATRRDDVLALTALVYPHYFRPRAIEMGRYFGIDQPGADGVPRLAAIIGERLGTHGATELSAICTHPDFNGRGYARRLTAMLANRTLAEGRLPFLHVSPSNLRAKRLYERIGFRLRRTIAFHALHRA